MEELIKFSFDGGSIVHCGRGEILLTGYPSVDAVPDFHETMGASYPLKTPDSPFMGARIPTTTEQHSSKRLLNHGM